MSTTAVEELDRKRINYYTPFTGQPIYADGVTLDPDVWIDQQYWLDWLTAALESGVWSLLRTSNAVPQTNAGLLALRNTITQILEQGVANGGIAPGNASPDMTLDIRQSLPDPGFNGVMSTGYLLWIGLLSVQTQVDRDSRVSPPVKIWLKGAGAIHEVAIDLVLEG